MNCPTCHLKKTRWSSAQGFRIGNKAYCCMGCGFAGCTCIELAKDKRKPAAVPIRK